MREKPIIPQARQLARIGIQGVPTLFIDAGEKAWWRFIEFFTANIRNKNTREAYGRAVVVRERGADYVLQVKGNQEHLEEDIIGAFAALDEASAQERVEQGMDIFETHDSKHGRKEYRC